MLGAEVDQVSWDEEINWRVLLLIVLNQLELSSLSRTTRL